MVSLVSVGFVMVLIVSNVCSEVSSFNVGLSASSSRPTCVESRSLLCRVRLPVRVRGDRTVTARGRASSDTYKNMQYLFLPFTGAKRQYTDAHGPF